MTKTIFKKILSLGLVSCLILTAPGAQAYEAATQLAVARRNFSYAGTAFEYYLKLQGIGSTKELSRQTTERQQALSHDFDQLQTKIILEYQKLGLLNDPFWAPQLVMGETQLSALGLWFGIELLTRGTPENTQEYLQLTAKNLSDHHPDPFKQKPALLKRTLGQLFDQDTRERLLADSSDSQNPTTPAPSTKQNALPLENTGIDASRVKPGVAPNTPDSEIETSAHDNDPALVMAPAAEAAAKKSSWFFRTFLDWLRFDKVKETATQTAEGLETKSSSGGGSGITPEEPSAKKSDRGDDQDADAPGPDPLTGKLARGGARFSLAPQPASEELARRFDGRSRNDEIYLVSAVGGPVSLGSRDLSAPSLTASERRNAQIALEDHLGDDAWLTHAAQQDAQVRRLATEMAAYNVMTADRTGDPNGGDPTLREQTAKLEQAQAQVEQAITTYQGAIKNEEDWRVMYQQLKEISRSEESMRQLTGASSDLIGVLLLKRGYMFMDLALQKLAELEAEIATEKTENTENRESLSAKEEEALRKLEIAKDLYDQALRGEFVREVDEYIAKVEEMIIYADQAAELIVTLENILNGTAVGNLGGTFLDPSVVAEEIATWTDLQLEIEEQYDTADHFIDIYRAITEREPDDFDDYHYESVHLWTEELIQAMDNAKAAVQVSVDEFKKLHEMRENPELFYIGVENDPKLQTDEEQEDLLILRREGESLINFGAGALEFKTAESTLNALHNAYIKDAAFTSDIGVEPYYDATVARMEDAEVLAQETITLIKEGLEMERSLLVDELEVVEDEDLDSLIEMIEKPYQSSSPEGLAHRAYSVMKEGKYLAEDCLEFYNWKMSFLSSGPSFLEILESDVIGMQSELISRQLEFAERLLDFLRNYYRPSEEAKTDTYSGLISLYETGYGTLYEAEGTLYDKESEGLDEMQDIVDELADPFEKDMETIKIRLDMLNDMDDPAIRRLGRALSEAGDELLDRLQTKKFLIRAREERERKQRDLRESLEHLRLERERTQSLLERGDPQDPNFYKAWDMVQQGNLLYDPEGFDQEDNNKPGALFIKQDSVQKILMQAASMTGEAPSVSEWVRSLGLSEYEVIPVGSGPDSFYTVVHFAIGTSPDADTYGENILEDALIKFGNIGTLIGHNVSVSLYDFKDLEPAIGSRGIRTTFERDKENEKFINTTVIDIHNNLQQGHIFRTLVFENMAFMLLNDHLFISANGYGDFPILEGKTNNCLAQEIGLADCADMPYSYTSEKDDPPYAFGGRAKGVLYFHEVASVNAEIVKVFAQDPYLLKGYINTSLDPLAMEKEYFTIEGAILNYFKVHGGLTIDLAKIFSNKQTFAIEFFMEKEEATETNNGTVSQEYLDNYADAYNKVWKGAQVVKEINFKVFGHQSRLAMKTRGALDQDNTLEVAEEFSLYFPQGYSLNLKGALYGDHLYGKGSLNARIAPGTDIFLSYGNDRISTEPDLMIGLSSSLSIEQFRRNATASAERAMAGGRTLSDFQRDLDDTFDSNGRKRDDLATEAMPLQTAMMRSLTHDTDIALITNTIGIKEQETRQLRRVIQAGLSGQGGLILGSGYTNLEIGEDQNAYGFWSTAGGISVGVAAFFGLSQPQKKEALKEIAQMKVLLLDLKEAYEKSMEEFRLCVLRVILARLRLKQLETLKQRSDIASNALLRSELDLEITRALKERAIEEAALRARIGITSKDPLPKEIEDIVIDPANPQKTIEAAMKTISYPKGWNELLQEIATANPKKGSSPGWFEQSLASISPLQLLPFVDSLSINVGTTLEDSLGNAQASVGASVEVTLWDPEKQALRKATIIDTEMADLRVAQRLQADQYSKNSYGACFNRWALELEKKNLDETIPRLWVQFSATADLSRQLDLLDQITLLNRDISRVVLELSTLPNDPCPKEPRQKVSLSGAPQLLEQAQAQSGTLAQLALQQESAAYMEKAARQRLQIKTSLGISYNPVDNLWFETPATFFITDGWSWLIPALNIAIKNKATSKAESDYASTLREAAKVDSEIQTLELTQQIITSYLRLIFAKPIKDELVAKASRSSDPAEVAQINIDLLEMRRMITHESQRLLILLGKDPSKFEIDLEALSKLNPQATAEALRPWGEANLKEAPEIQLQSLQTRLELVRALEAQLLVSERAMNIKTEPVSAILQVAAQLVGSFFGDGGSSTSMVDLQSLARYRQDIERQIREWENASERRQREAALHLDNAEKSWQKDPTAMNLLGRELAWVSNVSGGFDQPIEYSYLPRSNTRSVEPVIEWKARVYYTDQGLCDDPELCTQDGARRPTSEVGSGSTYYNENNTKKVTFYEGFVQILLRRPEMINPRLMIKAEELQEEHQVRLDQLENDLRQARLSGLIWKYRYLDGQLAAATDAEAQKSIKKLLQETQDQLKVEFGFNSPAEYPAIGGAQNMANPDDLEALVGLALQYLIGDAPALSALRSDLALGQLETQAIIDNLRYQSMSPSFVLGYFREGIVGGLMLSAPLTGLTPGAELFRDLDRIVQSNMTSVLEARSLAADARERLARNYFEFRYLLDELAQRQLNLEILRRELANAPYNESLIKRYYQSYEELLLSTARLHELYLQIETDLKLLGVNIPAGLGRSSRDPWAQERRSTPLSPSEAQRVARRLHPSVMAGWNDLTEDQKAKRLADWYQSLESECRALGETLCQQTKAMSLEIQKDSSQQFQKDSMPIGIVTPVNRNGDVNPTPLRTMSPEEYASRQAKGQLWSYHSITGELLSPAMAWDDTQPKRIFIAPEGYTEAPPASAASAARAGALELHLNHQEQRRLSQTRVEAHDRVSKASQRQEIYLTAPDSYAVLSASSGTSSSWRVLIEQEALERAQKGDLTLKRLSSNEKIDLDAFKRREFWNQDILEIYLNGDYRFENAAGERVWTYEELWREGRLAVFEETPSGHSWNRVHHSILEDPSRGDRSLKILAYFGPTPEIVAISSLESLLSETVFVREIILTKAGEERLKSLAQQNLWQTQQAAYVYLKTVQGFSRDEKGRVTEIYLTPKEMEKAKKRHSKSNLYLSSQMTLSLTDEGVITEVLMKSMDGHEVRVGIQNSKAPAKTWSGSWSAVELGSDYQVVRLYSAEELKNSTPSGWAYYMDDRELYLINEGIFPGGADSGKSRALATVNIDNGALVLYPSSALNENTRRAQRQINRTIAHNVIATLALAAEIGIESAFAPWTLPFGAGIGGANTAERVATRTSEGSMEKSWGFWFDVLKETGDLALFKRIIPQPKDRLNDPSGYPVEVQEQPAKFWDRALYRITFGLCGRIDHRLVEVDPETHVKTSRYVRPGIKASKRSRTYRIEEEEARRQQALAQFNGGLALQESKTSRGVYGDYRDSRIQVIPEGESYDRAVASLRSIGVSFTPEGAFYLDVVPMEAEVSGQVIKGIPGAQENIEIWEEATQDHAAEALAMTQGTGGSIVTFYQNGKLEDQSFGVGEPALHAWQRQVQTNMSMSKRVLYDAQNQVYIDSEGKWLFNPATLTLVTFDNTGKVIQTYQAIPSSSEQTSQANKDAVLASYYENYSQILEQGAVVHLNTQGEIVSFEIGDAAVAQYINDHPVLSLADEPTTLTGQYLFDNPDGTQDLVINPAASLSPDF